MGGKQWSETEKLGAIVIAVRDGVQDAARRLGVPDRTIYCWLQDAGGIAEVRALANIRAEEGLSMAERAVYDAVAKRLAKNQIGDEDLLRTFRALIEARTEQAPQQAQAAAQANVHVHTVTINE